MNSNGLDSFYNLTGSTNRSNLLTKANSFYFSTLHQIAVFKIVEFAPSIFFKYRIPFLNGGIKSVKQLRLKIPSDKFQEFYDDLERLKIDPDWTITDVATKYNYTPPRIGKIFYSLFGYTYLSFKKSGRIRRANEIVHDPNKIFIDHKFSKEIDEQEFYKDLEKLKNNVGLTLEQIGKKYNYTREWVRQRFNEKYGSYTDFKKEKQLKLRLDRNDIGCKYEPNHMLIDSIVNNKIFTELAALTMMKTTDKLKELNYEFSFVQKSNFLRINDNMVYVRYYAGKAYPTGAGNNYYRAYANPKKIDEADCVIYYVWENNSFYIIPSDVLSIRNSNGYFYIPVNSTYISTKYPEGHWTIPYFNAWNLLNTKVLKKVS